jgi:hypothetical protein
MKLKHPLGRTGIPHPLGKTGIRHPLERSSAHPGFKAVQQQIEGQEGVSPEEAGAILGARTRAAGPAARAANPRLNRVPGGKGC